MQECVLTGRGGRLSAGRSAGIGNQAEGQRPSAWSGSAESGGHVGATNLSTTLSKF